jgi:hypothetical protein
MLILAAVVSLTTVSPAEQSGVPDAPLPSVRLLAVDSGEWVQATEADVVAEFGKPAKRKRNPDSSVRSMVYVAPLFDDRRNPSRTARRFLWQVPPKDRRRSAR